MISGGQLQLSYDNADLYEFINQIASTLAITPIVIDPEVKGTVTIHSSAPMAREDIFPLFNLILKNNNAALVKQGNVYQIVPISSGLKKGLEIIEHLPPAPEQARSNSRCGADILPNSQRLPRSARTFPGNRGATEFDNDTFWRSHKISLRRQAPRNSPLQRRPKGNCRCNIRFFCCRPRRQDRKRLNLPDWLRM